MRMQLRTICYFAGCIVLLSCCRNKEKKQDTVILHADTVKVILYELYLADEINTFRFKKDSSLNLQHETMAYYESIFEQHGTSYKEFMKSLNYYSDDPKRFAAITDSLNGYALKMSAEGVLKFIKRTIHGNHFKDTARPSGR